MKKLRHTAKESFVIQRNIKNVIYELCISETRIHKTFNANSFTKANSTISVTKELRIKNRKKKYEINKILKERKKKERTEFFINWKEYDPEKNQWKSEKNVKNVKKVIKLFRNKALKKKIVLRTKR